MTGRVKKIAASVGGVLALGIAYLFGAPYMFKACGSAGDYALERLRQCPAAKAALGDGIDVTWGLSYGSTESQGGLERASVKLPVSGSKGRGSYSYLLNRTGNDVRFAGSLEVDGKTIDVGTCVGGAAAEEAANTGTGSFSGRVKRSTHPNVSKGSLCNGSITLRGTKQPAQISLKCDGVTVYQGEGVAKNEVNDAEDPDDDTLTYTDDKTSDADDTPAVSLEAQEGKADGDSGTVTVRDVEHGQQPAFEIEIAL